MLFYLLLSGTVSETVLLFALLVLVVLVVVVCVVCRVSVIMFPLLLVVSVFAVSFCGPGCVMVGRCLGVVVVVLGVVLHHVLALVGMFMIKAPLCVVGLPSNCVLMTLLPGVFVAHLVPASRVSRFFPCGCPPTVGLLLSVPPLLSFSCRSFSVAIWPLPICLLPFDFGCGVRIWRG